MFGSKDDIKRWIVVNGNVFYEPYGAVHNYQTTKTADAIVIYNNKEKEWLYDGGLRHLKVIKIIVSSAIIFCFSVIFMGTLYAAASDLMDVQKETGQTYISLEKSQNTFETGMLDVPKEIRKELMLYQWIAEALAV